MPTAELTIAADLSGLRKQLESIPGLTAEQAKAMTAELNKSFRAAERSAKKAADATTAAMGDAAAATRKAGEAGKALEDRFGSVGSGAGKLAGALDMLIPGLGSVGQGVADLADVGEVAAGSLGGVAAPALGALAIAAAAVVPVMMHLSAEMEAEAEAARVMGTANAYARGELELQRVAALDLAVATGAMSEAQRNEADIRATSAQRLGEYLDSLHGTVEETRKAEIQNTAIAESIGNVIDQLQKLNPTMWLMKTIMGDSLPTATELTKKFTDYIGVTGKLEAAEKNETAARNVAIESTKKTIAAQIKASQSKATHAAVSKALTKAVKEEAVQMDALEAAERTIAQARASEMTESEKLREELAKLLEERTALAEAGKLTPDAAAKSAAAEVELRKMVADATIAEDLRAIETTEAYETAQAEARRKRNEEAAAAEQEFWARRQEYATQALEVVSALTTYALDQDVQAYQDALDARDALGRKATKAEKARAEEEVAEKRKQAMVAFLIDKAAKLAQALTATALATINALSMPPAPNYIAAGLAAAGGAVQVATIAAARPSFHSGGLADFAPDEASAVVRRGEAVLSPQGRRTMGDEAIRAANAGVGGSQTIIVQQVYRHRVFDSFVRDNLRTRGPLAQALGSGSRAGQRRS
jgi:hypothetical protein